MHRTSKLTATTWACTALVVATVLGHGPAPAWAVTILVESNGVDGAGCGGKGTPCRTITTAIASAAAGDTIVVGPGRYGDLDGDGTLGEPGEEAGSGSAVVRINKTLQIVSRDGAVATVIEGAGALPADIVAIGAPNVVFGKAKHGFTLANGGRGGLETAASGVRVGGNVAIANSGLGIRTLGNGSVVTGNTAIGNGEIGFVIGGSGGTASGNLARGNGTDGFSLGGSGHLLKSNVALSNGDDGFFLNGNGITLTAAIATGNLTGVSVGSTATTVAITGVAMVANRRSGLFIQGTSTVSVLKSNIFGNGVVIIGGQANCGTANQAPGTFDNVFWGAATGPGDDPADRICDLGGGTGTVGVLAAKPFKIKVKVP